MQHTHGVLRKETGTMKRLDPLTSGLIARRMANKRHTGGVKTVLNADTWSRMSEKDKARVESCLEDAAINLKCRRQDLLWAMDRSGILHVKKRELVSLD